MMVIMENLDHYVNTEHWNDVLISSRTIPRVSDFVKCPFNEITAPNRQQEQDTCTDEGIGRGLQCPRLYAPLQTQTVHTMLTQARLSQTRSDSFFQHHKPHGSLIMNLIVIIYLIILNDIVRWDQYLL